MSDDRFLLDMVFIIGALNPHDQYHSRAMAFLPRLQDAAQVWVTEAVLVEVGNALGSRHRAAAVQFIRNCYHTLNMKVVSVDTPLLLRALQLYQERADKEWGLTDCISFVVMQEQGLTDAVTADQHFRQAGYRALLLESE